MKVIGAVKPASPSVLKLTVAGMTGYNTHRGTDVLHASDLTKVGFCPREFAISESEGRSIKGMTINSSLRHTFDMGRDVEYRVQNEYMDGLAVGHWKCASCGDSKLFTTRPTSGCHREDITCRYEYQEIKLMLDSYQLVGGIDILVKVGRPKLRLVELKTMIKEQFVELKAPLMEHRVRTRLYMWMVEQTSFADEVDTTEATVLYVAKSYGNYDKETGVMSPFKEFHVKQDMEEIQPLIDQAKVFGDWKHYNKIPEGICPTVKCPRAKQCKVREACFSGDYPPAEVS